MKVIVKAEILFEVEIRQIGLALDRDAAMRAVEANWDSVYKHQARWADGTAPQLTATNVHAIGVKQ